MRKKGGSPFILPTYPEWRRAVKLGFRWQARFYLWLAIMLSTVSVTYLVITWFLLKDETEKLKPDFFSLVSYSDVYSEINTIADIWSPDSEFVEALFFVYPNTDYLVRSVFTYQSDSLADQLTIGVFYEGDLYEVRPVSFIAGYSKTTLLESGRGLPLPKHFLFDDSLLAFEYLKSQNEEQITQDYLDIEWPMILVFSDQSAEPKWELCYTFTNREGQNCFVVSASEQPR